MRRLEEEIIAQQIDAIYVPRLTSQVEGTTDDAPASKTVHMHI